jgi:hypothetical protein
MRNQFNDIIKEELQKFVGEDTPNGDKFQFRQVVNADFYNYDTFSSDYDTDIATTPITVNWGLKFTVNDKGVQKFDVVINSVEGIYVLDMLDKQTDQSVQKSNKNIAEVNWKFNIINIEIQIGFGLYVSDLDFDFKNKTCAVTFTNG